MANNYLTKSSQCERIGEAVLLRGHHTPGGAAAPPYHDAHHDGRAALLRGHRNPGGAAAPPYHDAHHDGRAALLCGHRNPRRRGSAAPTMTPIMTVGPRCCAAIGTPGGAAAPPYHDAHHDGRAAFLRGH